jgi:hypothetical protein
MLLQCSENSELCRCLISLIFREYERVLLWLFLILPDGNRGLPFDCFVS